MAAIHYYKKCEFNGYFSEHTTDKEKVTCSRCKNKYRLESSRKTMIVKVGKFLNVLDESFLTKDTVVISTLKHPYPRDI